MVQEIYRSSCIFLEPYINCTIALVPIIAVNIDVIIPIESVTANPLIGPVPIAYKIKAAIRVVMFASKIVTNAFVTIFDANITTLIAALILYAIGTGPIKGFAVTLSIGIITSMFTAIMGTRAIVQLMYGSRNIQELLYIS